MTQIKLIKLWTKKLILLVLLKNFFINQTFPDKNERYYPGEKSPFSNAGHNIVYQNFFLLNVDENSILDHCYG